MFPTSPQFGGLPQLLGAWGQVLPLSFDGGFTLIGHDHAAFQRAAQHRTRHGLKVVDALQLATAQLAGARRLVSNDRQSPPLLPEIECLSLTR